jgi:hypothetical protein
MRSLNCSSECYLAFTVFCPTHNVKWLNFYQIIKTITCVPETLVLIKHDGTLSTSYVYNYAWTLLYV